MIKTLSVVAGLAVLALASAAAAQTPPAAEAPKSDVAAATLPNPFAAPGRSSPAPAAVAPAAQPPAPPHPRPQPAQRALVAPGQARPLDAARVTQSVAAPMPEQEPPLRALLDGKGELVTIVHRGQQNGADIYQALFEHGDTQWVVGVDAAGKVAVFLFRETPRQPPAA